MCRASGTGREVPACTEPGGEAARKSGITVRIWTGSRQAYNFCREERG